MLTSEQTTDTNRLMRLSASIKESEQYHWVAYQAETPCCVYFIICISYKRMRVCVYIYIYLLGIHTHTHTFFLEGQIPRHVPRHFNVQHQIYLNQKFLPFYGVWFVRCKGHGLEQVAPTGTEIMSVTGLLSNCTLSKLWLTLVMLYCREACSSVASNHFH